eukprot:7557606-Alexandrium_andersonii.AAC.1
MFESRSLVNSDVLSNIHAYIQAVDKFSAIFDQPTLKALVFEGVKVMAPLTKLKVDKFTGGRVPAEQIIVKPSHARIKL